MRTISVDEFQTELKAQGVKSHMDFAFRCPICKTVQSGRDLLKAGAGKDFDDIERYLGFSCVGRFTGAGAWKKNERPGRGCDWSLGGLFQCQDLTVISPDGKKHPRFEPVSPDEAQAHAATFSSLALQDRADG